jgi:alanyl-tRNA synthetase
MQLAEEDKKRMKEIASRVEESKAKQAEANSVYTKVQADNSLQDNIRQTAIALDRHSQEWARLKTAAIKAEVSPEHLPTPGNMDEIMMKAMEIVKSIEAAPSGKEGGSLDDMVKQMGIDPAQAVQLLQQAIGGGEQ